MELLNLIPYKAFMKSSQVTIHDIARILKISASTVSRALNDSPRISNETKKKIRNLAKKMNYQPNVLASNLRTGRSKTIGVVVPHINRNFFSNVITGIEDAARNAGYRVMITQSDEDYKKEIENIRALIHARVDGILISISGSTSDFKHLEQVKENKIPLLFFDRATDEVEASSVVIDDFSGAYNAVHHLIEEGFKSIAHFGGPKNIKVYKNRFEGYVQALKDAGIEINPDFIFNNTLSYENGKIAAKKIFTMDKKPDAIFSSSDISALGAIEYFKLKKIIIPDDIALVGFANEPFTSIMEPGLTSVDQHSYDIGKKVAELFLEEVSSSENKKIKNIVLMPELIKRKSSLKKSIRI